MKSLSEIFAIDLCRYAVTNNRDHAVMRVDWDSAIAWSDGEVAERCLSLFKVPSMYRRGVGEEAPNCRAVCGLLVER